MIAAISESGNACKTEKYGITGHIYMNKLCKDKEKWRFGQL